VLSSRRALQHAAAMQPSEKGEQVMQHADGAWLRPAGCLQDVQRADTGWTDCVSGLSFHDDGRTLFGTWQRRVAVLEPSGNHLSERVLEGAAIGVQGRARTNHVHSVARTEQPRGGGTHSHWVRGL
jgi:hypothetical protein